MWRKYFHYRCIIVMNTWSSACSSTKTSSSFFFWGFKRNGLINFLFYILFLVQNVLLIWVLHIVVTYTWEKKRVDDDNKNERRAKTGRICHVKEWRIIFVLCKLRFEVMLNFFLKKITDLDYNMVILFIQLNLKKNYPINILNILLFDTFVISDKFYT